jgi:uncharacterized coiled-coil protein SlyX
MKSLIKLKTTTLLVIPTVLACFALLPSAQALNTDPDETFFNFTTAAGLEALLALNAAGGSSNSAYGARALLVNTFGGSNTAIGGFALISNTDGSFNGAQGNNALFHNTHGSGNMAVGQGAVAANTTGNNNVGIGFQALNHNNGNNVVAIGFQAGTLQTGNNDSVFIGIAGDTDNFAANNRSYIGHVRGVSTGDLDAIPVLIDSTGQLGTASSARRFKKDIKPMDQVSEAILKLKPVTFHYKDGDTKKATERPQYGLIAEDVAEVNPDLTVPDEHGQVYSVRYDAINVLLLNEFLKEHKKVEEQQASIAELKSTVAQQQKGMEALVATVKEQAAQIQKVSAQVELKKSAPTTVANK